MKIGIKYCGGCRASYNRKRFIDKLKGENSDLLFESAREDVEYDIVIVVNGCRTACANHTEYRSREKHLVTNIDDYKKISTALSIKKTS